MKKLFILLLSTILLSLSTFSLQAVSDEDIFIDEEVGLAYVYASSVNSYIMTKGKSITCTSYIAGNGTVTKITITQKLQKKSGTKWTKVASWTKTYSANSASYTNTKSSLSSGTYRTRTVAKVYKGSNCEKVSKNSSTVVI